MSELRRVHLLLELSRRGTIAAVAEATSYSTSGISQQLAALERDIGTSLLEPDGRRLKLTPAGEAIVAEAGGILASWEQLRARALSAAGEIGGELRLGVFQTGLLALGPDLLDALAAKHPALDVRVIHAEPEDAIPALRTRELDAAIIEHYPPASSPQPPDLHAHVTRADPMLLAVPPRFAGTAAGLSDLRDAPWVFEAPGSPVREWAERLCHEAGFVPRIRYQTSDVLTQLELVRQDRAAAFIPALAQGSRSVVRTLELPRQARTLQLVTRASAARLPAVRALGEALAGLGGWTSGSRAPSAR